MTSFQDSPRRLRLRSLPSAYPLHYSPTKIVDLSPLSPIRSRSKSSLYVEQSHANIELNEGRGSATNIAKIVDKKHQLLKLKLNLKKMRLGHLPNIVNIQDTVRDQPQSFIRRMDKELNKKDGQANLLGMFKTKMALKSINYIDSFRKQLHLDRNKLLVGLRTGCE